MKTSTKLFITSAVLWGVFAVLMHFKEYILGTIFVILYAISTISAYHYKDSRN